MYICTWICICRLTPLLRDQDGVKWREKLPPNPDEHRVLTAFYSNSSADPPATNQLKQDTPPNPTSSPTVDTQPSTTQSTQSTTSTASTGTTSTESTDTTSTDTTSTKNTGTSNKGSTSKLTDQEKFEEFRLKGNQFVKQVL